MERLQSTPDASPRMSQAEAEEVVALWGRKLAEQDALSSMPSTKDVSEALGVPLTQVEAMLVDIRRRRTQTPPSSSQDHLPKNRMRPRHWAAIFVFMGMASFIAIPLACMMSLADEGPRHAARADMPAMRADSIAADLRDLAEIAPMPALAPDFPFDSFEPMSWEGIKEVSFVMGGSSVTINPPVDGPMTSTKEMSEEIARIGQKSVKGTAALPGSLEDSEPVIKSLHLGNNVGWESLYRFDNAKLTANGITVGYKFPVALFDTSTDSDTAQEIMSGISNEQSKRTAAALKELHDKIMSAKDSGKAAAAGTTAPPKPGTPSSGV